jgi:hypothetical protein
LPPVVACRKSILLILPASDLVFVNEPHASFARLKPPPR